MSKPPKRSQPDETPQPERRAVRRLRGPGAESHVPPPPPPPPPPEPPQAGGEEDDEAPGYEVLEVRKAHEVPVGRKPKKSKHDPLVERVVKLRPGEVIEVVIPADKEADVFRGFISQIVRRLAQPRVEYRLQTRFTANGTVGIYCYPS